MEFWTQLDNPAIQVSLFTQTALEIVLGLDNDMFVSLVVSRLKSSDLVLDHKFIKGIIDGA